MDDYARIRLAYRDGMSIREISRTFGNSRIKIRQVLGEAVPRPYTPWQPRAKRCLTEPFRCVIDEFLEEDRVVNSISLTKIAYESA